MSRLISTSIAESRLLDVTRVPVLDLARIHQVLWILDVIAGWEVRVNHDRLDLVVVVVVSLYQWTKTNETRWENWINKVPENRNNNVEKRVLDGRCRDWTKQIRILRIPLCQSNI